MHTDQLHVIRDNLGLNRIEDPAQLEQAHLAVTRAIAFFVPFNLNPLADLNDPTHAQLLEHAAYLGVNEGMHGYFDPNDTFKFNDRTLREYCTDNGEAFRNAGLDIDLNSPDLFKQSNGASTCLQVAAGSNERALMFLNQAFDIRAQKLKTTKDFDHAYTFLCRIKIQRLAKRKINGLARSYEDIVRHGNRANTQGFIPNSATGIRYNCLHHSVSKAIIDMVLSKDLDDVALEYVLGRFTTSFNQRHGTQFSSREFLNWLQSVSTNRKIDYDLIEATMAPTLRAMVHERTRDVQLEVIPGESCATHARYTGFEGQNIPQVLAHIFRTPIVVAAATNNQEPQVFLPQNLAFHAYRGDALPSVEEQALLIQPQSIERYIKIHTSGMHFSPFLRQAHQNFSAAQSQTTRELLDSYRKIKIGESTSHDPMIQATQAALNPKKQKIAPSSTAPAAQNLGSNWYFDWGQLLFDLLMCLTVIGIIPVVLSIYSEDDHYIKSKEMLPTIMPASASSIASFTSSAASITLQV